MPPDPRKVVFPNPFYIVVLVVGTLFVITCLGYLAGPAALADASRSAAGGRGPTGGPKLALWLERRGPLLLGVEFLIMLLAGLLAMATDHWFSDKPPKGISKIRPL